jgi:ubiquitin conjugation factor E4 B
MNSAGRMPQFKAIKSKVDIEDKVQRRLLQVILRQGDERGSGVPLYLEQLAAELLSEDRLTFLSRDCIERVSMETLCTFYAGYDPPFSYLVACYRRALEKVRKAQILKDKNHFSRNSGCFAAGEGVSCFLCSSA